MKKILFCNIAWMKNYKGITDDDKPINGGSWVVDNNDAHEAYNFCPIKIEGDDSEYCLGFVETKTTNGKDRNQLHIEKIAKGSVNKKIESIDDVLVIWCAKSDCADFTSIVGWYNNATVYRNYQDAYFGEEKQAYNFIAKAENCVLLPNGIRHKRLQWYVPRKGKKSGPSYGFGQANVWFANNAEDNTFLDAYLKKIISQINDYNGENWLYKE